MRLLVEFGFVRRNLRRIHLQAIVSNAAALRSHEKAASWSRCAGVSTRGSAGDTRKIPAGGDLTIRIRLARHVTRSG